MSDFMTAYVADFYAASGSPAEPTDAAAADDSSERGALQAAISGGDPVAISAAARAVITRDLVQLGQEVSVLRERLWHYRLLVAAISSLPGVAPIPAAITDALRRTDETEVPYEAFPQAAAILQGYLTALQSNSAAVLT